MFRRILLVACVSVSARAAEVSPIERFDFGTEEFGALVPRGDVVRDHVGPRPPEFPNLEADNPAVQIKGVGARFEIKDLGKRLRTTLPGGKRYGS